VASIILLIGLPATGKYTVAKQIAARLEARRDTVRIVDNHYANNVIFNLLPVDGATPLPQEAWDRIEEVRDAVLATIETLSPPDWTFVMTLHATSDQDRDWVEAVAAIAADRGSRFAVIRLLCGLDELLRRVGTPDRIARMKLTSIDGARTAFHEQPVLEFEHPNTLTLDITELAPGDAADIVVAHVDALDPEALAP
jgi:hypothetical protein